ncbi:MAG: protein translocase subunit SecF [Firmicutes bacterium]|nr:protein translocase subunit SecF [Bacillota bacterium]
MFDFVGRWKIWFCASAAVIAVGLAFLLAPGAGLRMGIDFTGGMLTEIEFQGRPSTSQISRVLEANGFAGSMVQKVGTDGRVALIRTKAFTAEQRQALFDSMKEELGPYQVRRIDEVNAVIGKELARKALLALVIANLGMVGYITLRFEFKFAVAAVVALLHDVLVTVGVVSILGMEVNSPFAAALLTVIGYSVNDTIVVYDRIRENVKSARTRDLASVVNLSISETLMRSINTALTTLLAVVAVLVFGGPTIREFAVALLVGITAGTYSSIFIASPLWVLWKNRERRGKPGLKTA